MASSNICSNVRRGLGLECSFFVQDQLVAFQLVDFVLKGGLHGGVGGLNDTFDQTVDLSLDLCQVAFQGFLNTLGFCRLYVPRFLEHGSGELEEAWRRLQLLQQAFECAFQIIAADGLKVAVTAPFGSTCNKGASCLFCFSTSER